jgi:hypothetical protein
LKKPRVTVQSPKATSFYSSGLNKYSDKKLSAANMQRFMIFGDFEQGLATFPMGFGAI